MLPISLSDPVHPQSGSNLMKKTIGQVWVPSQSFSRKRKVGTLLLLLHVQLEVQGFSFVMQALQL